MLLHLGLSVVLLWLQQSTSAPTSASPSFPPTRAPVPQPTLLPTNRTNGSLPETSSSDGTEIALAVIFSLCPVIVCTMYCCNFVKPCPLVPAATSAEYKYAVGTFFNSGRKYGFPDTDGTVKSNYLSFVYNNDDYLSVFFAHPLIHSAASKEENSVFIFALVLTIMTVPLRILLEEFSRGRLAYKMGCGVWLVERMSIVFSSLAFVLALFFYLILLTDEEFYASTAKARYAIIVSVLQHWVLSNAVRRLNFFTIKTWRGGCVLCPQLVKGSADTDNDVKPSCNLFSSASAAFLTSVVLFGVGESTFVEDKNKFFEEMGEFATIDQFLEEKSFGETLSRNSNSERNRKIENLVQQYGYDNPAVSNAPQVRHNLELYAKTATSNSLLRTHGHGRSHEEQPPKRVSLSVRSEWRYVSAEGKTFGDFPTSAMRGWFLDGFFGPETLIRHSSWSRFYCLSQAYDGAPDHYVFTFVPSEGNFSSSI